MKSIKKQVMMVAAVLLATAGAAAHAEGTYAGASLASPHWNSDVGGVSGHGNGLSGKVFGGYEFTPNLGVELGVMDLGHMRDNAGETKAWGGYVDAVGKYPIANDWSVLGRIGLAEARFDTPVGRDTGPGIKLGAGVQYDINKTMAVVGEYEHYRFNDVLDSHANVGQVSVGLKIGF